MVEILGKDRQQVRVYVDELYSEDTLAGLIQKLVNFREQNKGKYADLTVYADVQIWGKRPETDTEYAVRLKAEEKETKRVAKRDADKEIRDRAKYEELRKRFGGS